MNHDFKRATIHDVAKAAQTSIATVSRVMSNSDYPVSEQLRQKIKEEARRLKYIPNSSATKSYRKATSQDIGVIIPNISNQFYAMTLLGIESVARQNGYNIVLFNSLNDAQKETEYLDILFERSVKGVILSSVKQYSEDVQFYLDNGMKFVLLDQKLENIDCPTLAF